MTEQEARERLMSMVHADGDPLLSSEEVDDLILRARCMDASGLLPSSDSWSPTWDLDYGAAEGWLLKAGKAAEQFNFAEDSQRFDRSQKHSQCLAMEARYRNRVSASVWTSPVR